jgi:hypothetical protein
MDDTFQTENEGMLEMAEELYLEAEGSPITIKKLNQALDYYLGDWSPDKRIYVFSPQSEEIMIEVLPTDSKTVRKARSLLKMVSKEGGMLMIAKFEEMDDEYFMIDFEESLICDPY